MNTITSIEALFFYQLKRFDNEKVLFRFEYGAVMWRRQYQRSRAFIQQKNTAGGYYCMTTKLNPWTQAQFRPDENTGTHELTIQNTIQVIPNPFSKDFQLYAKTIDKQIYHLQLTDALGRTILVQKGKITELNHHLTQAGLGHLPPGNYFLKLWKIGSNNKSATYKLLKGQ